MATKKSKITLWVLFDKKEKKYLSIKGFGTKEFGKKNFYATKKDALLDTYDGDKPIKVSAYAVEPKFV